MKKKYKCRLSATSPLVTVKGKVIRLSFEPDVISSYGLRGCSYSTDDKDIQRAIEHHPRFLLTGKLDSIWTDDVEPKEEIVVEQSNPAVEPVVEKKVVRRKVKKEEE